MCYDRLNSIADNTNFRKTSLYQSFRSIPLGFIDAGTAENIFHLIFPVASLTYCMCFEPDKAAYDFLFQKYTRGNPFAKLSIFNTALTDKTAQKEIFQYPKQS